MAKKKMDELFRKYLAGETTLEEERQVFNSENQPPGIREWAAFISLNKQDAPEDIKRKIWDTLQRKDKKKRRFMTGISGIAASIILLITSFLASTEKQNFSYEEKELLLQEVMAMFPEESHSDPDQNIIYEDDLIIIYVSPD